MLSFAIIKLNTSLHNPCVKDKPSVEQFITMNRGINEGTDLPKELLQVCKLARVMFQNLLELNFENLAPLENFKLHFLSFF